MEDEDPSDEVRRDVGREHVHGEDLGRDGHKAAPLVQILSTPLE